MRDYYMGAEVEVEELELGSAAPDNTPPQGVVLTRLESDGWTRKYLYKALSGRPQSEILIGEIPPDPALDGSYQDISQDVQVPLSRGMHVDESVLGSPYGRQIPLQMGNQMSGGAPVTPMGDARLNLPARSSIPMVGRVPFLGQVEAPTVVAPAAPLPQALAPQEALPPEPVETPALPDCTRPVQLPDGTVLDPDSPLKFKDFCAMLPYIAKFVEQTEEKEQSVVRPGGTIPLSRGYGSVPSFGPAGGPFSQGGGGGGGGGGSTPGPGPIGVVTGNTPVGGPGQGTQGPPGPQGPQGIPGIGSAPAGIQKTDGNFSNSGAMVIVPGTTFTITVGADGKATISFSGVLTADIPGGDVIYDVFAGIQVDSTQYLLFRNSEQQGAGGDRVVVLTAVGTLYVEGLTPGDHTVSMIYGDNPALNHFTLETSPSQPASVTAQHS